MAKPTPMSAHKAFHGKAFIQHTPPVKPGTTVAVATAKTPTMKPKFGAMYAKGKKA